MPARTQLVYAGISLNITQFLNFIQIQILYLPQKYKSKYIYCALCVVYVYTT